MSLNGIIVFFNNGELKYYLKDVPWDNFLSQDYMPANSTFYLSFG